jgi:hypothetical protein
MSTQGRVIAMADGAVGAVRVGAQLWLCYLGCLSLCNCLKLVYSSHHNIPSRSGSITAANAHKGRKAINTISPTSSARQRVA